MTTSKKRPSAPKRKPRSAAASVESISEDTARGRDVLLERIESQMQVVIEAVTGLRGQLTSELSALEERLSARISVLEQVVRQSSDDIKKNSDDIRTLREEVAQLRRDFERRAELDRVSALEERVARVEAKLGIAS